MKGHLREGERQHGLLKGLKKFPCAWITELKKGNKLTRNWGYTGENEGPILWDPTKRVKSLYLIPKAVRKPFKASKQSSSIVSFLIRSLAMVWRNSRKRGWETLAKSTLKDGKSTAGLKRTAATTKPVCGRLFGGPRRPPPPSPPAFMEGPPLE